MKKDVITMTREQFRRYQLIQEIIDGQLTVSEVAAALDLSERQVMRLKKGVELEDAAALIHGNTRRRPANAISEDTISKILEIRREDAFKDCNFQHFREILDEHHDVQISYASLHALLTRNGITSPKKRRHLKPHRSRKRQPQIGFLVQTDATPYCWFHGDRKRYALHGAIDDATGQVLALYMTKNECLRGYFKMIRRMIENFGVPISLYADRHTIFQSPLAGKVDINCTPNDTQLGRALKELNMQLIPARSPQAKGRIERLWQTLQSRLPVEFALRDIHDPESANKFLKEYIYQFNAQFAVEPENTTSLFGKPDVDLQNILCIKETRSVDAGGVFSYRGRSYKLIESPELSPIRANTRVTVLASEDFGIRVQHNNNVWDVLPFVPPKRRKKQQVPGPAKSKAHPVPEGHPWTMQDEKNKGIQSVDSWAETRRMLERLFLEAY